ncbi:hypothetical protein [Actinomycetospora sp. NBRC 106378]|uniref:hypothetical protein n=1 Tax=Actinomycetospora sp. NBRC 106378 TaxID=3032208 RepID=UPI0024A50D35|nr:hypothetical protein [Actinomycetospora sp. NBRC 106378]GLZ54944.1 glycoprotein [Actinomycetospora sp. NBRC 106378]
MIAGGAPRTLLSLVVAVLGLVLTTGVPTALAAPAQTSSSSAVELALDATPRVVGPDSGDLTVTGRLTNRGPVPVRDLGIRAQRGVAVATDREVDRALTGAISPDPAAPAPPLTPVAGPLDPGDTVPVTLRVPLAALALPGPGVYPVVVEVNGTPGAGVPERVAAERFLLPVTGLPGGPTATPTTPTTVSLLYPLTDRPRRLPVPPGAPTLLADDSLAATLAPDGRLGGLVAALTRAAPLGSPAAAATCLAVDADLLETARDMSGGYQVSSPTGPRPGSGAAAAGQWLAAVRAAAVGRCVVALPYADADLLATSRGNMSDLTTAARTLGAARTAELLGVTPVPDTTVPAGGLLDERSLADLAGGGARALVVDGSTLTDGVPPGGVGRFAGSAGGGSPLAVATDPLVGQALAQSPGGADAATGGSTVADGALATQDALAVTALRALGRTPPSAPVVLAPPADWPVDATAATALLGGLSDLARRGLVTPVDLGTLVARAAADPATPDVALGPGDRAAVSDQSSAVLDRIRAVRDGQRDLLAASRQDRTGAPTPADYLQPLTGALLRSLSAAGRGDPALQRAAASDVAAQLATLRGLVRVVQPAGTYSLGSSDAPLLLTVENQLPVAVDVTVVLDQTPGVRASPVAVHQVPAFGSYQFQVALDVERSGQFTIDATAHTPGGEALGPTARLLLRSTAYGTITVWLTASAAVVLVILSSLRVALRVRAARRERRSRRRRRAGTPTDGSGPGPTTDDRTLQAR